VITATLGSVSGHTTLTVTGVPVAVALQLTPSAPTVATGGTVQFTAVELWSDNSTHPIPGGDTVTWNSATTTVATISALGNPTAIGVAVGAGSSVIKATDGSLSGTATLTVQAAAARFAFDAEINDLNLNEYAVVPSTGAFTPVTATVGTNLSQQFLVHPSGHFLYAIFGDVASDVALYNINSTTGAVTSTSNEYPTGGTGSAKGVIDPTGRFLYVVVSNSTPTNVDGIYSFVINQTDGTLTPTTASPYIADANFPVDVLADATGKYVYVVDDGANVVSGYSIDQSSGALTPLSTPTFATGGSPYFSAIDPTNTYLYVPNNTDATVSILKIDASTGLLTPVATTPPLAGATGSGLVSIAITPNDQNIYITDNGGQVFGFAIGSGGNIGAATTGSPYAINGSSPSSFGTTIDPSGVLLVVCNNAADTLSRFAIGAGGVLTPYSDLNLVNPPSATDPQPLFLTFYSAVPGQ
jgi:6-phosphogluconolactonase (cycloisomerase 2 family)